MSDKKKTVTITVAGKVGTGKSSICRLLKDALIPYGIEVEINCLDDIEERCDNKKITDLCLRSIKDIVKIKINEVQLNREL